jgi:outer membrane cobalamin receptor
MVGVINVVTKNPSRPESAASVGMGSYGRIKFTASHSRALFGGYLLASGSWETSEGDYEYFNDNMTPYTPGDDYTGKRRDNAFENADVMLKWENARWKLKGLWTRRNRNLPLVAPGLDHMDGRPQKRGALLDTRKYEFSAERRQTSGSVEWGIGVSYAKQDKDYDSRRGNSLSQIGDAYMTKSAYDDYRAAWRLDANAPLGKNHFIELLIEGYNEELDVFGDSAYQFRGGRKYYSYSGWDAQLQDSIALDRSGSLVLTPSFRWHEQDGVDKATWQIGARKDFSPQWGLKATYGTYSRAPNMYERYGDGAYILPAKRGLEWETGTQWDAGVWWNAKMFGADSAVTLSYFGRESENLIEFDMESPNFGRYKNIADSRVKGVELEWRLVRGMWDLSMSGTWMDAVNDTPDDTGAVRFEGKKLPNRPEWAGTARLTRNFNWGSAYAEAQHTGENYGDSSEKTFFDARTVWNAGVKWSVSPHTKLFVGVDDIFDTADEWKLRPAGNGPTRMLWYPTEGRYFYATLEYSF